MNPTPAQIRAYMERVLLRAAASTDLPLSTALVKMAGQHFHRDWTADDLVWSIAFDVIFDRERQPSPVGAPRKSRTGALRSARVEVRLPAAVVAAWDAHRGEETRADWMEMKILDDLPDAARDALLSKEPT